MFGAAPFGAVATGAALRDGPQVGFAARGLLPITGGGALALNKRLEGAAGFAWSGAAGLRLDKRLAGAGTLALTGATALRLNKRLAGAAVLAIATTGTLALNKRLEGAAALAILGTADLWTVPLPTPARTQPWGLTRRWPNKAPAERLDYALDAAGPLAAPDPDDSVADVESVTVTPDGLVAEAWGMQGGTLVVWLSGGAAGEDYTLDAVLRTSRGRRIAARVRLGVIA